MKPLLSAEPSLSSTPGPENKLCDPPYVRARLSDARNIGTPCKDYGKSGVEYVRIFRDNGVGSL